MANKLKLFLFGGAELTESQEKKRKLLMYLICGGLTTVVNFVTFAVFDILVNMDATIFGLSVETMINQTVSWVIAVLFAYFTNRIFVFVSKGSIIRELLTFAAARIVSLVVLEVGLMAVMELIMNKSMGIPSDDVMFVIFGFNFTYKWCLKLINCVFITVANYVLSKLFVFKKKDAVNYKAEGKDE